MLCSERDKVRAAKRVEPAELTLGLADVFSPLRCGLASFGLADGELITCNKTFADLVGKGDMTKLISVQPFIENLFVPEFRKTCRDMLDKLRTKVMSTVEAFGVVPERHDGKELKCTLFLRSAVVYEKDVVLALLTDPSEGYPGEESYSDLKGIIANMPGGLLKFRADDHRIDFISDISCRFFDF